jgi:ABC-type polysaccharide/polyol phosphate transport system ATPase subunit
LSTVSRPEEAPVAGREGSEIVLECRGVTKRFYHYEHRTKSLTELVVRAVKRKPIHIRRAQFELDAIDIQIRRGDSVALIGSNGSGKSTLLRLMAGIYPVTEGVILRQGRLVAVIELGTTFQPELTGAENVVLYAAALGMTRREVAQKTPAIFEFSGVEDFADVPLKYYSTGMRSRLAFAIASCAEPDVLLLDEILAVGDVAFQARCYDRLKEHTRRGGTLVIVSHDSKAVRRLCTTGIWVDHGRLRLQGPVDDVIAAYEASVGTA